MAELLASVTNIFYISQIPTVYNGKGFPVYGNVVDANNYFQFKFNKEAWTDISSDKQIAALVEATRIVDNLQYSGFRTSETQYNQFPRNGDTVIPVDIVNATYEIALKIVEGYDIDFEINNLSKTADRYGSVGASYDRLATPEHLRAGVPSSLAWSWLKKYLVDPREISLSRKS